MSRRAPFAFPVAGRRRGAPITGILVAVAAFVGGCGSPDDDNSDGRELSVELTAGEYFFRASEAITLQPGDVVTFEVRNEGELDHQLEVLTDENRSLGLTERIPPGAQREVTVSFDEPGLYRVICDVDDHLSRGQQAVFEVASAADE